jgi:hypothetical protein
MKTRGRELASGLALMRLPFRSRTYAKQRARHANETLAYQMAIRVPIVKPEVRVANVLAERAT